MEFAALALASLGFLYFFGTKRASHRYKALVYLAMAFLFYSESSRIETEIYDGTALYFFCVIMLIAYSGIYLFLIKNQNENIEDLNDFDD
ncbi:MAG: hypothetical protein KC478_02495 [Bacteriovoracaceae bacterium]|nr:hypothetical protein [Bacteriovoracaceae bacterium]